MKVFEVNNINDVKVIEPNYKIIVTELVAYIALLGSDHIEKIKQMPATKAYFEPLYFYEKSAKL